MSDMVKLYRRSADGELRYHEAWVNGREVVEHWGIVGERGSAETHPQRAGRSAAATLQDVLARARAEGFEEIDPEDHATLIIEYALDSWGSAENADLRHEVESRMNELLGWTGLGNCDGGSIGSGTMEVCCFVVDFETAKRVIEADLRGTRFANFTRIYDEDQQ
jgi:predicted DNA-binding WGR domain protein